MIAAVAFAPVLPFCFVVRGYFARRFLIGVVGLLYLALAYLHPRIFRGSARATFAARRQRTSQELGVEVQIGPGTPHERAARIEGGVAETPDAQIADYAGTDPELLAMPELLVWIGASVVDR